MLTIPGEAPNWLHDFAKTIESELETIKRQVTVPTYAVGDLPSASKNFESHSTLGYSKFIFVTDETGGAQPAYTDGTNWRRCSDRAVVS